MAANDRNDAPRHPGRILLDRAMAPLGISRNQLARDIDVPVGRISDITNGKRGITADTALRLARYFGTDAELWLKLQADYDLHVARSTVWPDIAPRVRVLDADAPDAPGQSDALLPAAAVPDQQASIAPADDSDDPEDAFSTDEAADDLGIPPAPGS
ncbi:MAG: HigA family addiction module antidote protein [Alphaproteobacteria bacterium]|nr:HigA family addiction module antidote protein [Alphaproteobacteria bacterium]